MALRDSGVADSPSSRDFISRERMAATTTSRTPIQAEPIPSKIGLCVRMVRPTPRNAKIKPRTAAESSIMTTGNSGALALRMYCRIVMPSRSCLLSLRAVCSRAIRQADRRECRGSSGTTSTGRTIHRR